MSKLDGQVEYDVNEIKSNFNALLYLMTENMAVSLEILKTLQEKGVLAEADTDAVLAVTGDKVELTRVYNEVFTRFIGYYQSVQRMLQNGTFDGPAENLVKESPSEDVGSATENPL